MTAMLACFGDIIKILSPTEPKEHSEHIRDSNTELSHKSSLSRATELSPFTPLNTEQSTKDVNRSDSSHSTEYSHLLSDPDSINLCLGIASTISPYQKSNGLSVGQMEA